MDEHPDSALHYLSAYADSIGMQPEETRMYYHLLTHQAKDKLYVYYPKLSNIELQICCFVKISIPINNIATFIGCTRAAVTQARTRLYKKMLEKEDKACDLNKFISDL